MGANGAWNGATGAGVTEAGAARGSRLSIIIEWANARLNGESRAARLLEQLSRQWQEIQAREYPAALTPDARTLLASLAPRPELLLVSSTPVPPDFQARLQDMLAGWFDVGVHLAPGLEYYPLKNLGRQLAAGDLLLFVDCDVLPDAGWLAHLLGSFARPDVHVVCAQTYVAPADVWSAAFAMGWTYELRDPAGGLWQPQKFYANSIAFREPVFRKTGFRPVGHRSRGAVSMLRDDLAQLGVVVWENRAAGADHPPPSGLRHLAIRALAAGRDHYMHRQETRSVQGLGYCVGTAAGRLVRGWRRTRRHWRTIGLTRPQIPAVL